MSGALHLAWRYLVRHRTRTLLLAVALGLTLALPLAVRNFVRIAQAELRSRAEATPLVLGAKGSALELTLNALYFRRRGVEWITMKDVTTLKATGLCRAIPLYVRFHSQESPIVGTTLDYFAFRGLRVQQGHMLTRLGDCVIGANVARKRHLRPGDPLYSSPEQVFDISGVYPLQMRVVGVLAESHGADDDAVFADIKTAWVIEGIGHGHDDPVAITDPNLVLDRKADNVAVTNGVRMFNQITDKNIASFHFHGDEDAYALSAVLAVPHDAKAQALLLGRYQGGEGKVQMVRPAEQMDALMGTLFQAEKLAVLLLAVLGVLVIFIAALVFALSFKLRRREFATLEDIGISRGTLRLVKTYEVLMVSALASGVVAGAILLVQAFGASLVRLAAA